MQLKKVRNVAGKIIFDDIKDSTLASAINQYALFDDSGCIIDLANVNEQTKDDIVNSGIKMNLCVPGDKKRYNIIDMLIPYAVCDVQILKLINQLMYERRKERDVLIPLLNSAYYQKAIEYWEQIPQYLINVMIDKEEWLVVPYSFVHSIFKLVKQKNFSSVIYGILFLNGLDNFNSSLDFNLKINIKEVVYDKLREATVELQYVFYESHKVKELLKQTGNLFDFSELTFNNNERNKMCKKLKEPFSCIRDMNTWETKLKAFAYNDSFIDIMVNSILPKILLTNNKYVSTGEKNTINKVIVYLKEHCGKTDYSPIIEKLKSYEAAPNNICSFKSVESLIKFTNLMPYSDFIKYVDILYEFRIAKVSIYYLEDARSMFNILNDIYDKRKFIKLAKLMLSKVYKTFGDKSTKKDKLINELNYIIRYHNYMYSDQKVSIDEII